MNINTLGEKHHADSKYENKLALTAIPDSEPLRTECSHFNLHVL